MISILKDIGAALAKEFMRFAIAFSIGTAASAIACWYYNIPMIFALIGGLIVLGVTLALMSESSIF